MAPRRLSILEKLGLLHEHLRHCSRNCRFLR